jgi:hypothetical protein
VWKIINMVGSKNDCHAINFFWLGLFFASFFSGSLRVNDIWAQEQPANAADSLAVSWEVRAAYEIDRLRLLRWINSHQDTAAVDFWAQVQELQHESEAFAKQQDYVTAQLILDTALELAGLRAEPKPALIEPDSIAGGIGGGRLVPSALEWRREILFGVDLWRQEFELGFADRESLFVERDGNPFVGVRLNLNRNPALKPLSSKPFAAASLSQEPRALNFSAYALLKSSRDYDSGELEFGGRQSLVRGASWRFQNRLEGTRYRRDLDLQYWQNMTSVVAAADAGKNFRFEVADEFRLRRYHRQNEFYSNYIQNQASFGAIYSSSYATRLDSRYNYTVRKHDFCDADNFFEHRLETSVFQSTANNSAVLLENIWRHRIYPDNTPGSACVKTFLNTYQEEFARADLRLGLSEVLALRVEGDFALRQHQTPSDSTPDFLSTTVNPQLQFKLSSGLQISAGYLYLLRVYNKNIIQEQPSIATGPGYSFHEDYYSHGFTLGVDLIRASGLLCSVNENFEMRTYPNAAGQRLSDFGLYDDRTLTLCCFSSPGIFPALAGNAANFDNDHSRINNKATPAIRSSPLNLALL